MMEIGELCSIWSGVGSPGDPKNYLLGFVVKKVKRDGEWNYRVCWNDLVPDNHFYAERDIDLDGWGKP